MSLLVIFGAGASFDSSPAHPPSVHSEARPPLANELFDNRLPFVQRMNVFPMCLPIIPLLQNLPENVSVEQRLEQLQAEATRYPLRHQQLASVRFYLQHMLYQCQ